MNTRDYLREIGVAELPPLTSPFDPGYDPMTLASHLDQSAHLMSILKISMSCWMIASEKATHAKIAAAKARGVQTVTGGGPFEIAVVQDKLPLYMDLCADLGVERIECGEGFTESHSDPREVVTMANTRGLDVQFELGKKHSGAFRREAVDELIDLGNRWMDAGAVQLVLEARESARGVGLFDRRGNFNSAFAERFVAAFGLAAMTFEAPNKSSQFAILDHFGREVQLCNVRLEEFLRVEIYRRGIHSDAFGKAKLRPGIHAEANSSR